MILCDFNFFHKFDNILASLVNVKEFENKFLNIIFPKRNLKKRKPTEKNKEKES